VLVKKFDNTQASSGGLDIVDNQKRETLSGQRSAAGYEDMSQAQETSRKKKDCDIQQLEEAYEDMGVSQATERQPVAK